MGVKRKATRQDPLPQSSIQQFGRQIKPTATRAQRQQERAGTEDDDADLKLLKPKLQQSHEARHTPSDASPLHKKRRVESRDTIVNGPQLLPTPDNTPQKDTKTIDHFASGESEGVALVTEAQGQRAVTPTAEELPQEAQDLIKLHEAFHKSLNLLLAHSRGSKSIDVRDVINATSTTWNKRVCTLEDIRRLVALQAGAEKRTSLQITRFGTGRTCVQVQSTGKTRQQAGYKASAGGLCDLGPVLKDRWLSWTSSRPEAQDQSANAAAFVAHLPLCDIDEGHTKDGTPLLAKGQQRLLDLKGFKRETTKLELAGSQSTSPSKPKSISERSAGLMERLKAKKTLEEIKAGPATTAESERNAACQRLAGIVPIICMRTGDGVRTSRSIPQLVDQVQTSSKSPMSREEIEKSLSLLAEEIAPGYATLVKSRATSFLVIDHSRKPKDLNEKIRGVVYL